MSGQCRFCGPRGGGKYRLIKYGVRHYAHADCGLAKKGRAFLDALTDWQCTQFPYFAAKDAGPAFVAELLRRCDRYEQRPPLLRPQV